MYCDAQRTKTTKLMHLSFKKQTWSLQDSLCQLSNYSEVGKIQHGVAGVPRIDVFCKRVVVLYLVMPQDICFAD